MPALSFFITLALSLVPYSLAGLPYNPTHIFLPSPNDRTYGYVLEPPSSASTQGQLLSFTTTKTLLSSGGPYSIVSSSLPFLASNTSDAYVPVLDTDGSIIVFAGNCIGPSDGASSLWRFTPSSKGSGAWAQLAWSNLNDALGTNFLAAGFAYSPNVSSTDSSIYSFGGMCPWANETTATWLSAATYSNEMPVFTPGTGALYTIATVQAANTPIAEAGFSITSLPSITVNSSTGFQSTQQEFLLLGGQSGNAFINMSNVAVFSLPQATWSFISVGTANGKTDLMSRATTPSIAPRSGHTAVLSEDGSAVIVYGGWVGDTDTPATPQLAILSIGDGFAGSNSWTWAAPTTSGSNYTASGLYGHGAVVLPGNVMMITGGYNMSNSGSSVKRQTSQVTNGETFYFNISSSTWLSSYDATAVAQASSSRPLSSASGSNLNSTAAKAGLGVGLVLGILAIFVAGYVSWLYSRRLDKRRQALEDNLDEKRSGDTPEIAQGFMTRNSIDIGLGGPLDDNQSGSLWARRAQATDNTIPWISYDDGHHAQGESHGAGVRDANRTGAFLGIPSPQRGLRRPPPGRRNYRFDEHNNGFANARITPIEEHDEEDFTLAPLHVPHPNQPDIGLALTTPMSDPFMDPEFPIKDTAMQVSHFTHAPLLDSKPPTMAKERQREMDSWVKGWAAADAILRNPDRASPTKTDRTLSSLSDESLLSDHLFSTGPVRALSGRSIPVLLAASTISSPNSSPTNESFAVDGSSTTRVPRPRINLKGISFTAAYGDFSQFQAESEVLLGSPSHIEPDVEPTFTRQRSPVRSRSRLGGWVGSVRRAIPSSLRSVGRSTSMGAVIGSPSIGSDGYYTRTDAVDDCSTASSPTKKKAELHAGYMDHVQPPRRSVSDGSNLLLAGKRGAKDWNFDPKRTMQLTSSISFPASPPAPRHGPHTKIDLSYRRPIGAPLVRRTRFTRKEASPERPTTAASSGKMTTTSSGNAIGTEGTEEEDEEDWDVEAAVRDRLVQVMFTVPREKLRVVNAGEADLISLSDSAGGRSASSETMNNNTLHGSRRGR